MFSQKDAWTVINHINKEIAAHAASVCPEARVWSKHCQSPSELSVMFSRSRYAHFGPSLRRIPAMSSAPSAAPSSPTLLRHATAPGECHANTREHASQANFARRSNSTRRQPFQECRRSVRPASRYFPTYSERCLFGRLHIDRRGGGVDWSSAGSSIPARSKIRNPREG